MASSLALAAGLRAHADSVRWPRQYIGVFGLVAWGALHKRRVQLVQGREVHDGFALFGPGLAAFDTSEVCLHIGCRATANGLRAVSVEGAAVDVNPWVVGVNLGTPGGVGGD